MVEEKSCRLAQEWVAAQTSGQRVYKGGNYLTRNVGDVAEAFKGPYF